MRAQGARGAAGEGAQGKRPRAAAAAGGARALGGGRGARRRACAGAWGLGRCAPQTRAALDPPAPAARLNRRTCPAPPPIRRSTKWISVSKVVYRAAFEAAGKKRMLSGPDWSDSHMEDKKLSWCAGGRGV